MLASDAATLPDEVQESIRGFFTATEAWLMDVLEEGRAAGSLQFAGSAADEAALLLATIELVVGVSEPGWVRGAV